MPTATPKLNPTAPRTPKLSVAEAAARLDQLRERIRDTEEDLDRGAGPQARGHGSATGHLEEWASAAFDGDQPPAGVLWARVAAAEATQRSGSGRKLIAWIGEWCWIHPRSVGSFEQHRSHDSRKGCPADRLNETGEDLTQTGVPPVGGAHAPHLNPRSGGVDNWLWLKTRRQVDRVWAIELCCRNPAVSVVVADGRGLAMAATRRLQLAARASGVRVLLARTPDELSMPSAAPVRGIVDACVEDDDGWPRRLHNIATPLAASAVAEGPANPYAAHGRAATPPRWTARLLRRKGPRPTDAPADADAPDLLLSGDADDGWVVEKRHARMVVRPPVRLADRPLPAEAAGHRRAG